MDTLLYAIVGFLGYLIGGFPTGVVLSKRKYGIDVREMGSGNIGATNVTRVFGWYAGVLTLVVDFFKGYIPLYFVHRLYPDNPWMLTIGGISLVVGHCFSPYLKFRGGKGVATSLGCLAFVAPLGAAIAGGVYLILLLLTKISAVGSLGGILAILFFLFFKKAEPAITILFVSISVIVVLRHHQNIRRLIKGA